MYYIFSDINECVNVTCGTNQKCVDIVNGYLCQCVQGFTGENCTVGKLELNSSVEDTRVFFTIFQRFIYHPIWRTPRGMQDILCR